MDGKIDIQLTYTLKFSVSWNDTDPETDPIEENISRLVRFSEGSKIIDGHEVYFDPVYSMEFSSFSDVGETDFFVLVSIPSETLGLNEEEIQNFVRKISEHVIVYKNIVLDNGAEINTISFVFSDIWSDSLGIRFIGPSYNIEISDDTLEVKDPGTE